MLDQARTLKVLQMKRQRGWQEADPFADDSGRQALGSLLDEQSKYCQTIFMGQRTERVNDNRRFHVHTILQINSYCQLHCVDATMGLIRSAVPEQWCSHYCWNYLLTCLIIAFDFYELGPLFDFPGPIGHSGSIHERPRSPRKSCVYLCMTSGGNRGVTLKSRVPSPKGRFCGKTSLP